MPGIGLAERPRAEVELFARGKVLWTGFVELDPDHKRLLVTKYHLPYWSIVSDVRASLREKVIVTEEEWGAGKLVEREPGFFEGTVGIIDWEDRGSVDDFGGVTSGGISVILKGEFRIESNKLFVDLRVRTETVAKTPRPYVVYLRNITDKGRRWKADHVPSLEIAKENTKIFWNAVWKQKQAMRRYADLDREARKYEKSGDLVHAIETVRELYELCKNQGCRGMVGARLISLYIENNQTRDAALIIEEWLDEAKASGGFSQEVLENREEERRALLLEAEGRNLEAIAIYESRLKEKLRRKRGSGNEIPIESDDREALIRLYEKTGFYKKALGQVDWFLRYGGYERLREEVKPRLLDKLQKDENGKER